MQHQWLSGIDALVSYKVGKAHEGAGAVAKVFKKYDKYRICFVIDSIMIETFLQ